MYVICVYDVGEKRCIKVMKTLRKYLFHIQNSVFEGELTPSKYKKVQNELSKITNESDQIIFYFTYANKQLNKDILGNNLSRENIII